MEACTWKWEVTGTGEQEGRRGTKGHRQEVMKGAAQVWRMTHVHFLPNPDSKSKQHLANVAIGFKDLRRLKSSGALSVWDITQLMYPALCSPRAGQLCCQC